MRTRKHVPARPQPKPQHFDKFAAWLVKQDQDVQVQVARSIEKESGLNWLDQIRVQAVSRINTWR